MLDTLEREDVAAPTASRVSPRPLGQIIFDGKLVVGPQFAERILREGLYPGQRKPSPLHVDDLAEVMRRGRFDKGSQLLFGRLGERVALVNGQHRVLGVIASGTEIEFDIAVVDCEDEDALRALYYRQDRLFLKRTDAQILTSVGVMETHGVGSNVARSAFKAFSLIQSHFGDSRVNTDLRRFRSDDARLAFGVDWWKHAATYERLIKRAPMAVKIKLLNAQLVAVALITIKHQPVVAETFWMGLADDDGLHKGDARKTLLDDITRRPRAGKVRELAAATALAWNAFFERRKIASLRASETTPVRILGTPFNGKPL
jgi:hypothetical protein